ncbi:YccT family protein [Vibrio aphrogenes]|uniref:YccT family protein n=1 Tax=Vibrio aphrogenes TaxID=1891186 RepID=UPI000B34B4FB|nr:DUF2057 domain-containing protein [Vibrio aphrogenes]
MKSLKILLLAGLVGASFQAAADVKINLNRDVQPLVINGEELGFSLSDKSEFILKDGQNQLVLQVSKLVQNRGEYEKFNSAAIVVTFSASNASLTISPEGKILTTEDAKQYNKNPKLLLVNQSNKSIAAQQGVLVPLSGLTRDYTKELAAYNKSNNIIVAGSTATAVAATSVSSDKGASKPQEMVEYWYGEASDVEKEAFSSWAFQNRKQVSNDLKTTDKPSEMLDYWYKKASPQQRSAILSWLLTVE